MFYAELPDVTFLKLKLTCVEEASLFSYQDNFCCLSSQLNVSIDIRESTGKLVKTVNTATLIEHEDAVNSNLINVYIEKSAYFNTNVLCIGKVNTYCSSLDDLLFISKHSKKLGYYNINIKKAGSFKTLTTFWHTDELYYMKAKSIVALGSDCRSMITCQVNKDTNERGTLELWRESEVVEIAYFQHSKGKDVIEELNADETALNLLKKL